MGTAMKHPVPDQVRPPFIIFDIRALWRSALNPVWHRMLYSCTHMAMVSVKGLILSSNKRNVRNQQTRHYKAIWHQKKNNLRWTRVGVFYVHCLWGDLRSSFLGWQKLWSRVRHQSTAAARSLQTAAYKTSATRG